MAGGSTVSLELSARIIHRQETTVLGTLEMGLSGLLQSVNCGCLLEVVSGTLARNFRLRRCRDGFGFRLEAGRSDSNRPPVVVPLALQQVPAPKQGGGPRATNDVQENTKVVRSVKYGKLD